MRTDFIGVLKTLHAPGLDRTQKVSVGGIQVSPGDVVAACLPDPVTIGPRMTGKTCAGLLSPVATARRGGWRIAERQPLGTVQDRGREADPTMGRRRSHDGSTQIPAMGHSHK